MRPDGARGPLAALGLALLLLVALAGCLRVRAEEMSPAGKSISAAQFGGPSVTAEPSPSASAPAATASVPAETPSQTATPPGTLTAAASPPLTVGASAAAVETPTAQPTFPDPFPLLFPSRDARDEQDGVDDDDEGRGNRLNIVRLANRQDGQLRVRGHIQLNGIPDDEAKPINQAIAYSSCTDCQTFAIALQLNLISKTAHTIAPENSAIAVNYRCTRCVTVARAVQYVRQVDDPRDTPHDVREIIRDLDKELRRIHQNQRRLTAAEANARINQVIARFKTTAGGDLDDRRGQVEREDDEDRKERTGRDRG
jgi:hypothetical protein